MHSSIKLKTLNRYESNHTISTTKHSHRKTSQHHSEYRKRKVNIYVYVPININITKWIIKSPYLSSFFFTDFHPYISSSTFTYSDTWQSASSTLHPSILPSILPNSRTCTLLYLCLYYVPRYNPSKYAWLHRYAVPEHFPFHTIQSNLSIIADSSQPKHYHPVILKTPQEVIPLYYHDHPLPPLLLVLLLSLLHTHTYIYRAERSQRRKAQKNNYQNQSR